MANPTANNDDAQFEPKPALHFTPAEWRFLLEHSAFLEEPDNRWAAPRSLMGMEVVIVPDHRFG